MLMHFLPGGEYLRGIEDGDRIYPLNHLSRKWWFTSGFPPGSGVIELASGERVIIESVREYLLRGRFRVLAHFREAD